MVVEHTLLLILQALCLALAASGLAVTDWAMNKPQRWSKGAAQLASHLALTALCVLWSSALLTVWQDITFDLSADVLSRKALISMVLAGLLSLNGVFMLRGLQETLRSGPPTLAPIIGRAGALAQACGCAWLLAAYFAISRPLTGEWALSGLALSMAAVLVMAGLQGWRMLRRATPQDIVWESRA
jgi:hypothetical protein